MTGRRNLPFKFEFFEEPEHEAGVVITQVKAGGTSQKVPTVNRLIVNLRAQGRIEIVRIQFRVFAAWRTQRAHGGERPHARLRKQRGKSVIEGLKVFPD